MQIPDKNGFVLLFGRTQVLRSDVACADAMDPLDKS